MAILLILLSCASGFGAVVMAFGAGQEDAKYNKGGGWAFWSLVLMATSIVSAYLA